MPNLASATVCFTDFRENYRKFEAWNARQRHTVLRERYAHDSNLIFRDLRDDSPAQVDCLVLHRTHTVLAWDPASQQVHFDSELDTRGTSEWRLDGQPVTISSPDHCVAVVQPSDPVSVDAELEQVQYLSSVDDIGSEFVCLWGPRWQKHQDLSPDQWHRVLGFANAYLPHGHFDLPPLSLQSWKQALKHSRPRAARGPDGFALADLRNMPDCLSLELLQFLSSIEMGVQVWPAQWLLGLVCALKKPTDDRSVNGYRPIVLLSLVYRCWSGLRARQLLRCLKDLLPPTALGFLPGREATEFWWKLEAYIELSCLQDQDMCGFSTDIQKAFNCLPREPILQIAAQLGFPSTVITPWRDFLGRFQRRFLIRQCVSEPVGSSTGFPGGCALSTTAMNIACLLFHRYFEVFGRQSTPHSYVDNWACTASSTGQLAHGICLCHCVLDMLDLTADSGKTYVWATQPDMRSQLKVLGLPVVTHARELGGVISFGKATRNAALVERCKGVKDLFARLRRSPASLKQKLSALPRKIWARALHGISACPLAAAQVHSLRCSATQALKICPAGCSSLLRLSIHECLEVDPGFYQLRVVIRDLRRMCAKHPCVLQQWQMFMSSFMGQLLHGPFSKLLSVLNEVGWCLLQPPVVQDTCGRRHDLLSTPTSLLKRLLEQAWLDHVANQHKHRKQMCDLDGLDRPLLRHLEKGLGPLRLAQLNALRSGAFIFDAAHSKYDLTVTGLCPTCHVEDTPEHRICHCPCFADARAGVEWVCSQWPALPKCTTHHLLPIASPATRDLHRLLADAPDLSGNFSSSTKSPGVQHIFTDGSCFLAEIPELALASWGAINASTGLLLSCGPVPGLAQTVPRAELWAAISALKWGLWVRAAIIVWADSAYVVKGIRAIMNGCFCLPSENADLWLLVQDLTLQYSAEDLKAQHVPSHLDPCSCESALEEWLAHWNNRVDRLAVLTNCNRCHNLVQAHQAATDHHFGQARILCALFQVYYKIADGTRALRSGANTENELVQAASSTDDPDTIDLRCRLTDDTPLDWRLSVSQACGSFPGHFVQQAFEFVFTQDAASSSVFKLSWVELLVLFVQGGGVGFPVRHLVTGLWVDASSSPLSTVPTTLIAQLRVFRHVIRKGLRALGLLELCIGGLDLSGLGIGFPQDGICIGCDCVALQAARRSISRFCIGRSVQRIGAFARPFSFS